MDKTWSLITKARQPTPDYDHAGIEEADRSRQNQPDPTATIANQPHGHRLAFRARVWRLAVLAAGLDGLRIHDLRHTAVALWIAAGANKEVSARAGHSL
jgi:integrase